MAWELKEGVAQCPPGFVAGAVEAGIKYKDRLDLSLIVAKPACAGAAMFTKNKVKAAPVVLSSEHLQKSGGKVGAILFNSGCANAATGPEGMENAIACAQALAKEIDLDPQQVLLASTGVIGVQLPMNKMLGGIPKLVKALASDGLPQLARAIMTTDTTIKMAMATETVGGKAITISGAAKGSGMIHPDMATMLVLLATDAAVTPKALREALRQAVEGTFHRISVDGDSSTNDAVFCLASGASGTVLPEESLVRGLTAVCRALALQIVKDGEGAKKLITVTVHGTANDQEAEQVARTIGSSLLVRTAVAGGDPNWGRILAAAGRAGVPMTPETATISVNAVPLFERGRPASSSLEARQKAFREAEVTIRVDLGRGSGSATIWTCDLTEGYIRINADYTT